jgi:RPA family protein
MKFTLIIENDKSAAMQLRSYFGKRKALAQIVQEKESFFVSVSGDLISRTIVRSKGEVVEIKVYDKNGSFTVYANGYVDEK